MKLTNIIDKIKSKIWQCRINVDKTAQLNKFFLNAVATTGLIFLLDIRIIFILEVAILKTIYNTRISSSNINLTLKVNGRMIFPLA